MDPISLKIIVQLGLLSMGGCVIQFGMTAHVKAFFTDMVADSCPQPLLHSPSALQYVKTRKHLPIYVASVSRAPPGYAVSALT